MRLLLTIQIILFLLAACSPAATPTLKLEVPTPISECFPYFRVLVWNDANGDAVFDPGEAPLAGIPVNLKRIGLPGQSFHSLTGPDGIADLYGSGDFGKPCDEIEIEVIVPEGFMHASPTPLPADLVGLPSGATLRFGLAPAVETLAP